MFLSGFAKGKERVLRFPAFLALGDWTLSGQVLRDGTPYTQLSRDDTLPPHKVSQSAFVRPPTKMQLKGDNCDLRPFRPSRNGSLLLLKCTFWRDSVHTEWTSALARPDGPSSGSLHSWDCSVHGTEPEACYAPHETASKLHRKLHLSSPQRGVIAVLRLY